MPKAEYVNHVSITISPGAREAMITLMNISPIYELRKGQVSSDEKAMNVICQAAMTMENFVAFRDMVNSCYNGFRQAEEEAAKQAEEATPQNAEATA